MSYCISIAQWNIRLQLVFIELIQDMKRNIPSTRVHVNSMCKSSEWNIKSAVCTCVWCMYMNT